MKSDLVSVIIPCYNVSDYVEDAINSLLIQSYQNLEIIAIDDCSTDDTWYKLENLAGKDSRIRIHKNPTNLKLIQTLNLGIELATGDYIARMDADDISDPSRIEKELNLIRNNQDIDIVSVFPKMIDNEGKYHSKQKYFVCTSTGSAKFVVLFQPPILHAGILTKSSVLKKNHFLNYPEYLHIEDYELWVRLLYKKDAKLKVIPKVLYGYRINLNSVSYLFTQNQRINHLNLSKDILLQYLNYNIDIIDLRIILLHNDAELNNYLKFGKAINILKEIESLYLQNSAFLTKREKREIYSWVQQRIIRICLHYILKGTFLAKFYAIIKLAGEFNSVFCLITYQNIISRIEWTIKYGKYKTNK